MTFESKSWVMTKEALIKGWEPIRAKIIQATWRPGPVPDSGAADSLR